MISDIITRDTRREEWDSIRERLKARIMQTFGTPPVELLPFKNEFKELERYTANGFLHIKIKYHVFAEEWAYGLLIFPKDFKEGDRAKAVLTIHGTNGAKGKLGVCDPVNVPRRAYATELAERGFITFSPDQYGFGEAMNDEAERLAVESFYKRYPNWSLSCRRVLGHIRALDVLDQLDCVEHSGYGVIGNSLGGQASFYIAAFDERIKAAVVSTGISPNVTNVYRDLTRKEALEPGVTEYIRKKGKTPWELNEMLSLCAPRAVLCLEPFNDPYNPYTSVTIDCIKSAWSVYNLLGRPDALSMYIHGDGHDTTDVVRRFAYDWLAKYM